VLSVSVAPAQIGPLLLATGVAGTPLTVTVKATPLLVQPVAERVTVSVPL
jgi:hypothetical protein